MLPSFYCNRYDCTLSEACCVLRQRNNVPRHQPLQGSQGVDNYDFLLCKGCATGEKLMKKYKGVQIKHIFRRRVSQNGHKAPHIPPSGHSTRRGVSPYSSHYTGTPRRPK